MMAYLIRLLMVCSGAFLMGCSVGNKSHSDMDNFMSDAEAQPVSPIEAMHAFTPYEPFAYKASGLRSPFEPPIRIKKSELSINSHVRPDESREKHYLEQFDIEDFSLVGSLGNDDGLWALVRGSDSVYRVSIGDYMGKNHGRIVYIDDSEIRLNEIIPAGADMWIERPRVMRLKQAEQ